MRPCADIAFEWIRNGRKKFVPRTGSNWEGTAVACLIPNKFEAYAKILHTVEANYANIDHPLTDRENVVLGIPSCDELKSFVETLRREHLGPRIRWQDLAKLLGVPFQAEICHEWFRTIMTEPSCWSRLLSGPGEGFLDAEAFLEVVRILSPSVGNQECFFRFAEIPFIATHKPILYSGPLDELKGFLKGGDYRHLTPEYWWPTDRTWCLCSDYDLNFTFVAGSRELISTLLASAPLEVMEVSPETRVDSLAPIPN
jgi:hypothetical protein